MMVCRTIGRGAVSIAYPNRLLFCGGVRPSWGST